VRPRIRPGELLEGDSQPRVQHKGFPVGLSPTHAPPAPTATRQGLRTGCHAQRIGDVRSIILPMENAPEEAFVADCVVLDEGLVTEQESVADAS